MKRASRAKTALSHPSASEWVEHEHISEPARAAAERLLESSGSPELAKHVIDVVDNESALPATPHYELANQAGFPSYLDLVSASARILPDELWLIAPLRNGACMAWNERSLKTEFFRSRREAEEWIRHDAPRR